MLFLCRVELIFFIVAVTGPCCGCGLDAVLIMHGCFSYGQAGPPKVKSFLLLISHHLEWAVSAQGVGKGHSQDSSIQLIQGISQIIWHHDQHIKWEKKKENVWRAGFFFFLSQVIFTRDGVLFPWGWLNSCQAMKGWEWIILLCLHIWLLLYLLNCLYLNPELPLFSLLPFQLSPPCQWREWVALWGWVTTWGYTTM